MKKSVLLVLLITFACALGQQIFAQTGVSLEVELKNIEASANKQGVSAVEKHDALVRLAHLRQLSGDIEGAARNWLEAAAAVPGKVDDDALLSCAYCLAAMGEWDRAITALEPLLPKSPRARFLDTAVKAIKTGDTATLAAIVDNPEYSEMKSQIIFVLWKLSHAQTAEKWRQRLVAEFPQTPEGRLAVNQSSSSVVVRPSPFWLFAGGYDSLAVLASEKPNETPVAQTTVTQSATSVQTTSTQTTPSFQVSSSQANVPQPSAPQATVSTARLQTGVFSRQANAQTQITNLKQAGFSPSFEQRIVNGNEMWAVTVPAGTDQGRTIRELREAGFESFPVK
ncbi:SPOR domain-containing protein [Treponema sp. R6D11]